MATPFIEIYDYFLSQIDDDFLIYEDEDDLLKERYLLNSIPKFRKCKKLKNRLDKEFVEDLDDVEIMILAKLMVIEYYNPLINRLSLLKQSISNRDFSLTSQANHLTTLTSLRDKHSRDLKFEITQYTYENKDMSDLQ